MYEIGDLCLHALGKISHFLMQEIEVHKKEQEGLIRVNQALEAEVKKLLRDPKTNTRLQMFPEFFPSRQK